MIDNWFEFQLGTVKYKGKSVGGDPPIRESGQALRAQNSQLVQGEDSAIFNMRPDVLVFKWTDWSGGEGQNSYDAQEPARYQSGRSIDPWSVPGTLRAGPYPEATLNNALAVFSSADDFPTLVAHGQDLRLVANDGVTPSIFTWDSTNLKWGAAVAITSAAGVVRDADADSLYLYILDQDSIIRWDGTTFSNFATAGVSTNHTALVELGQYVYIISAQESSGGTTVTEFLKSAAIPVAGTGIYAAAGYKHEEADIWPRRLVTTAPNRIYLATVSSMYTTIHAIIPTSAAGAGSGSAIAVLPAQVRSMAWSGGLLFCHATTKGLGFGEEEGHGYLMYVNPEDGTYGVVDRLRPYNSIQSNNFVSAGSIQRDGVGLSENYIGITAALALGGSVKNEVVVHDAIRGALHPYARFDAGSVTISPLSMAKYKGDVFMAEGNAVGGKVMRLVAGKYEGDAISPEAVSPLWDFGLVDEKILSSIRVSCEVVPTDWTVSVDYDLDETGSWTNAGSVAAGTKGSTFAITTGSSTKKFRQLRLRVQLVYGAAGVPTTTPIVLSIEARAQVTQKLRSWAVILDCSDDQGQAQEQNLKGHQKIDNIQTAGTPGGDAVTFKNGYSHRQPNSFDTYNVTVDDYEIFFIKPGEGYAVVRLIEVA